MTNQPNKRRKLSITTLSAGVNRQDGDAMDEMLLFFNRPLTNLEFAGLQAKIEEAMK